MIGHRGEVGMARQPAFGDEGAALRRAADQFIGAGEVDREVAQVAIVDADQPGPEDERAVEFRGVMDFDQHVHAMGEGGGFDLGHLCVGERRDDDQDRISAERARFRHLPGIDHEVLAQHGEGAGGAGGDEIVVSPKEIAFVGQHRQAGRAAGGIGAGVGGRVEIGADQPLGRAGLFDLGDQAIAGRLVQRAPEAARRGLGRGALLQRGKAGARLASGDLLALVGADFLELVHRPPLIRSPRAKSRSAYLDFARYERE